MKKSELIWSAVAAGLVLLSIATFTIALKFPRDRNNERAEAKPSLFEQLLEDVEDERDAKKALKKLRGVLERESTRALEECKGLRVDAEIECLFNHTKEQAETLVEESK